MVRIGSIVEKLIWQLPLRISFVVLMFGSLLTGCKEEEPPPLDCSQLKLNLVSKTNVASCGQQNGQIMVAAADGVEPYRYEMNSISNTNGVFSGLLAGSYEIKVTGGNNDCTKTLEVTVENEGSTFEATAVGQGSTICAPNSNGFIEVTPSGGVEPYSFSLNGISQAENTFQGLGMGEYFVEATDAQDCVILIKTKVPGMRYETVKSIIELNCAIANCHNGDLGAQSNYLLFENVKENSRGIRTRTENKSMPPVGNLSAEQIALISCWVDEGANN